MSVLYYEVKEMVPQPPMYETNFSFSPPSSSCRSLQPVDKTRQFNALVVGASSQILFSVMRTKTVQLTPFLYDLICVDSV